uniref:SET domain-containing protein n=1 Tax=Haptolina brevifila TaxID=156173 RepID=A0A7S2CIS0_9EUKA|mmetsp:Transcript_25213/g.50717  ORF Transcript_25213/g.50717 Transcript_25213/m.50717 type:complete len:434 (+) Transcript_25213:108-1409(+)
MPPTKDAQPTWFDGHPLGGPLFLLGVQTFSLLIIVCGSRDTSDLATTEAAGLVLRRISGSSSWSFSSSSSQTDHPTWERVVCAAFGGYDVVAKRAIRIGEVIITERPLLEATSPDQREPGWAEDCLRAFCNASKAVRAECLAMHAGGGGSAEESGGTTEEMEGMVASAVQEVGLCANKQWRRKNMHIDDNTLQRVCMVFNLNSYEFGSDLSHSALFKLGCMLNHSCDSNVRYTATKQRGHGCFIARRDISMGESLCTNYIGEYATIMSTPARRDVLMSSKLFKCLCARCTDHTDLHRHVPCPGCHPRDGSERELAPLVAYGHGTVHYARPSSAEAGALWLCSHCTSPGTNGLEAGRRWRVEQVIPGPGSMGGVSGRAWERLIEKHVLHLDTRAVAEFVRGNGLSLHEEVAVWYEQVARSLFKWRSDSVQVVFR